MSTSTASFTVVENVVQPMRDGTLLRADLYLPEGDGPFPALVERSPYSKDNSSEVQAGRGLLRRAAVRADSGCARPFCVRGQVFAFSRRWLGAQPRRLRHRRMDAATLCDGNVGTVGGSYSGATQYRLAPTRPPHLKAMFVRESSADYHANGFTGAAPLSWRL